MYRYLKYVYMLALLALVSCSGFEDHAGQGYPIYISASLEEEIGDLTEVKAPYISTAPSVQNPLGALVLVSTTEDEYANTGENGQDGPVKYHTNATFTSTSSQLLSGPLYNSDPLKQPMVYFSALSPQNNWTITGTEGGKNYKARYVFDGTQDLMFASKESGKYNGQKPVLVFRHLLTYMKLFIYAENEDVSKAWGKINTITISNAHDMGNGSKALNIDLSNPLNGTVPNVSFEEQDNCTMSFYDVATNSLFPSADGYGLQYSAAKEVAYVMMAPVTALETDPLDNSLKVDEFVISIRSENRTATVGIDLMKSQTEFFTGSTMGKQFSITLKFTMGNTISVRADVQDWETGGIGIGDVIE